MKNQIIHLDGIDKSGKSTLLKYIVNVTAGQYLVHDRSFISQIAYGRLYKRNINEEYFWERFIHANLANDEKFVYLHCMSDTIKERIIKTNEKDINVLDIEDHKIAFNQVIKEAKEREIRIIEINATNKTVEDIYLELQTQILNEEIRYCNECSLCSREVNTYVKNSFELGTGKLIPRVSSFYPKYLIVGMNPSNKRLRNSEYPFDVTEENDKNKVFLDILKKYGIFKQSIIQNLVNCSTETNKITTLDYNACKHHLETTLELFRPCYIICLGDNVFDILSASNSFKDQDLIKIFHPAYQYAHNAITVEEYDKHIYNQIKHTL